MARWLENLKLIREKFEASDPRDAVYALLGLVIDGELPLEMRPDYRLPSSEVFHRCTMYLLKHGSPSLDFLLSAEKGMPRVPSWVPNWTNLPWFYTGEPKTSPTLDVTPNGEQLIVGSVFLGRIISVISYGEHSKLQTDEFVDRNKSEWIAAVRNWYIELEGVARTHMLEIQPQFSVEEWQFRWKKAWESVGKDFDLHDFLVARQQAQLEDLNESSMDNVGPLDKVVEMVVRRGGIGFVEGGHLTMLGERGSVLGGDFLYTIKGVRTPCILRRSGAQFRFVNTCPVSSYDEDPGDDFYEQNRVENVVLI